MIVTVGENVVDMIGKPGGTFQAVPGGSPLNIAIALGRLEVPAGYAMPISSDKLGDDLVQALEHEGVKYLPGVRPDRPTGLALVSVSDDGQPVYSFYREGAADVALEPGELPVLPPETRHLQIGGAPSIGQDQCGDMLTEWALGLDESLSMSLDPNVRPALIADKGRFLERCDQLLGRCNVCRLSNEDAEYMYGRVGADDVADLLLKRGVALAVVTLGAQGSYLATNRKRVLVTPWKLGQLKDTVAAGDCFLAAMLCWLMERDLLTKEKLANLTSDQLNQVGSFASSGAAINCSRDGCDPPTKEEIQMLLARSI